MALMVIVVLLLIIFKTLRWASVNRQRGTGTG